MKKIFFILMFAFLFAGNAFAQAIFIDDAITGTGGSAYVTDTSGNFGVGTTNPTAKVDVRVTGTGEIRLGDLSDGGNVRASIKNQDNLGGVISVYDETEVETLKFRSYQSGTTQAYVSVGNVAIGKTTADEMLDVSGNILASGNILSSGGMVGIGTTTPSQAIDALVNGNGQILLRDSSDSNNSRAKLENVNGFGGAFSLFDESEQENVKIRSYGKIYFNTGAEVGIGTTDPTAGLDVRLTPTDEIRLGDLSDSGNVRMSLKVQDNLGGLLGIFDESESETFKMRSYASSNVQGYMTAGYFGIGMTDPATELEVEGTIRASNSAAADDTIDISHDGTDGVIAIGSGDLKISDLAGTYGSGSAYVCVNDDGTLFASDSACP